MSVGRDKHNDYQQRIFAREVDEYCESVPEVIQQRLARIVGTAELAKAERVLDVGTGTGVLVPFIHDFGVHDIVGCDLSSTMLSEARRRYPEVTFWCGDIVDLPDTFGMFHAVFFNAMFGNVWDQQQTLRIAAGLLRDGGRICISHPLGSRFVAGLNRREPLRTPHRLPNTERLHQMTRHLPLDVVRCEDELDFYAALLRKQETSVS